MADVRLGFSPLSRWSDRAPQVGLVETDRLALLSDLAHIVPWEIELPGRGLVWHAPLTRLLGGDVEHGSYWLPAPADEEETRAVRAVGPNELGDVLLAPIVECVRSGILWENFEMVQEILAPDGTTHQLMVRAVTVPGEDAHRCFGIVAEVTDTDEVPWVSADVAERLQLLVEHSPDGVIVHQDGVIVYGNPAAARMAGLPSTEAGIGREMLSFIHPDYVEGVVTRLIQMSESGGVMKGYEVVIVRDDGVEFPVEVSSVRTTWGDKPAFQVILHDVSERRQAEQAARERLAVERRYAAAVAVLDEGVIVLDRDGSVQAANDSAAAILGRRLDAGPGDLIFTGGQPARRQDGTDLPAAELPVAAALEHGLAQTNLTVGVSDDDGAEQWLSVSTRLLPDHGPEGAVVCSVSDITQRKQLLDRLAWEARHDTLTGLANRAGFLAAVQDALDAGGRAGTFVFFVNLDRFKFVNDTLGHGAGDEVLGAVGRRLQAVCPRGTVSRLHGDEFAVLEPGLADADAVVQRAEDLRSTVAQPLRTATGRTVTVTASIGIVPLEDGRDAAGLLADADLALLKAKGGGRGRIARFDRQMREEIGNRLELEDDLRQAITAGGLRLEYQPVASLSNGRVLGVEALARWDHPERGPLPPFRFVQLAEESDLIHSLGEWVLREGCTTMARWRHDHPGAAQSFLSVNLSPKQLDGNTLLPALEAALADSRLPASALVLEITESGFISDDPANQALLGELRAFGVRLAIDDFGTGYSSLAYLKRLPVSYLKIDRAFVMGLGADTEDEQIVKSITELGHGLGLRVIAEGVETTEQRAAALSLGCDLFQGYLLARPTRPEQVPAFWGATAPAAG